MSNYTPEEKQKLKSTIRMALGVHGLVPTMEVICELLSEWGEGDKHLEPDTFWLEASAHFSTLIDQLRVMSRYHDH